MVEFRTGAPDSSASVARYGPLFADVNCADALGVGHEIGWIAVGHVAEIVVLDGGLADDASVIRNVGIVSKGGIGVDSRKRLAGMQGQVGYE